MYVHIGGDVSIPAPWIIGIFDLDRLAPAGVTAEFMKQVEEEGRLDWMTGELPRSMIVTVDRVFLSPVSTATLRSRLKGENQLSKGHYE